MLAGNRTGKAKVARRIHSKTLPFGLMKEITIGISKCFGSDSNTQRISERRWNSELERMNQKTLGAVVDGGFHRLPRWNRWLYSNIIQKKIQKRAYDTSLERSQQAQHGSMICLA